MIELIIPLIIAAVAVTAAFKKVDIFSSMAVGIGDGLSTLRRIFPSLIIMLTAVYMLRASGVFDYLSKLAAPLFNLFGIPSELAPLVFMRPISGSAGLAITSEIIYTYGADSLIGRTAAVMMGSTETTFYTISIYFGSVGISKTRYAIPAALVADLTGFAVSALCVRLLF